MEDLKTQGNAAFSAGNYSLAIEKFTEAIELDSSNHVLYSNRSAAYCGLKDYNKALDDANKTIRSKPDWSKGYGRKAAALYGMGSLDAAKAAYEEGLKLEPDNSTLKKGLVEIEEAKGKSQGQQGFDLNSLNPFTHEDTYQLIASHPELKSYLNEPDFVDKLGQIKKSPNEFYKYMEDKRIMKVIQVILSNKFGKSKNSPSSEPQVSKNAPPHSAQEPESSYPSPPYSKNHAANESKSPQSAQSSSSENDARKASDKEKEMGNSEYLKKNFEAALIHYEKAFELDPSNIPVLNNKAAVLFEKGDYEGCIRVCEEAIEQGRELLIDYKTIAKAFGRMGSAYAKLNDYDSAIKYYNKSLTEHRTPEILSKLKDTEKQKVETMNKAYHNPALSEQERNAGNELFKKGEFSEALKHYSEAIKRDKHDPKNWSNRAACYAKLLAFPEAVKDCDQCIEIDPTFVKAYLRKASIFVTQKEHSRGLEALDKAREHDKEGKHQNEIESQYMKCVAEMQQTQSKLSSEETLQNAMKDPEIQAILTDPIMQQILQQMKTDPKAILEHMKNPAVANNMRKLMAAGVVRLG